MKQNEFIYIYRKVSAATEYIFDTIKATAPAKLNFGKRSSYDSWDINDNGDDVSIRYVDNQDSDFGWWIDVPLDIIFQNKYKEWINEWIETHEDEVIL